MIPCLFRLRASASPQFKNIRSFALFAPSRLILRHLRSSVFICGSWIFHSDVAQKLPCQLSHFRAKQHSDDSAIELSQSSMPDLDVRLWRADIGKPFAAWDCRETGLACPEDNSGRSPSGTNPGARPPRSRVSPRLAAHVARRAGKQRERGLRSRHKLVGDGWLLWKRRTLGATAGSSSSAILGSCTYHAT